MQDIIMQDDDDVISQYAPVVEEGYHHGGDDDEVDEEEEVGEGGGSMYEDLLDENSMLLLGQPLPLTEIEGTEGITGRFKFPDEIARDDSDGYVLAGDEEEEGDDGDDDVGGVGGGDYNDASYLYRDVYNEDVQEEQQYQQQQQHKPKRKGTPKHKQQQQQQHSQPSKKAIAALSGGGGGGGASSNTAAVAGGVGALVLMTSVTGKDSLLTQAALQQQLQQVNKKLQWYAKENEVLMQRLDASEIEKEIKKLSVIIADQEQDIERLEADNRGLQQLARHQAKQLTQKASLAERTSQLSESPKDEATNAEQQIHVLLERVKRLTHQNAQWRQRENTLAEKAEDLARMNEKLRAYITKLLREGIDGGGSIASNNGDYLSGARPSMEPSIDSLDHRSSFATSKGGGTSISMGAGVSAGGSLSARAALENNNPSLASSVTASTRTEAGLRRAVSQLQKSMSIQRSAYQRDVGQLKSELAACKEEKKQIEGELNDREKQARAQVLVLKQLRAGYEELAEGNRRLMLASDIYARPEAPTNTFTPRPQRVPSPPHFRQKHSMHAVFRQGARKLAKNALPKSKQLAVAPHPPSSNTQHAEERNGDDS